ncbi:hypothetical protein [Streptomyces syringium]|uniref:hypothetical protein n=1 Tax=Streptomyces syringium TaxID=76729 RepID=UPI0033F6C8BA
MARLPRVIDDRGDWTYLDFGGVFFAVDSATRIVRWSDPTGPSLWDLTGIRNKVLGPETYNHIELYYEGDWEPPAYTLRAAAEVERGDVITLNGVLRTVTAVARAERGKVDLFVDSADFAGPYPLNPQASVPVHPRI